MINFVNNGLDDLIVKSLGHLPHNPNHEGQHLEYEQTKGQSPHIEGFWKDDVPPDKADAHHNHQQQPTNQQNQQHSTNQQHPTHQNNPNQSHSNTNSSTASQANSNEGNHPQGNSQGTAQSQQSEQNKVESQTKVEPIGWKPRPYEEYREFLDEFDESEFVVNLNLKRFVFWKVVAPIVDLKGVKDWQNRPLEIDGSNPHHFYVKCESRFADFMEQKYLEEELSKIRPKLGGWDIRNPNIPQEIKTKYETEYKEQVETTVRNKVLENVDTDVRELAKSMIDAVKNPKLKREGQNSSEKYDETDLAGTTEFIGDKVTVVVAHSGKIMTFYPTSLDRRLALERGWKDDSINAELYMEVYIANHPQWLAGYTEEQREFLENRIKISHIPKKEQYFSEIDFIEPPRASQQPVQNQQPRQNQQRQNQQRPNQRTNQQGQRQNQQRPQQRQQSRNTENMSLEEKLLNLKNKFSRSIKLLELQRNYTRRDNYESFYKSWGNGSTFGE